MESLPTARAFEEPEVVQFSIFTDNRVGQLRRLVGSFDPNVVRVVALAVVDSVDFAIVRLVAVPSKEARQSLKKAGLAFNETELVVVELAGPTALTEVCEALVKAEVNIHYAYPLIGKPHGQSALAVHVEDPDMAAQVLRASRFVLLGERDLI